MRRPWRARRTRSAAAAGLLLLAVIVSLYYGRNFFIPVVFAITLALMLRPIVRGLSRLRIPESAGAGIVVLGAVGAILTIGILLYDPAVEWARRAPGTLRDVGAKIEQLQRRVSDFDRAAAEVEKLTTNDDDERVPSVQIKDEDWQTTVARFSANAMSQTVIVIVLLYFLLATRARLLHKALALLVEPSRRASRASVVTETERYVSRYLFTISVINFGLGLAVAAAMWAWNMPNPLLWGVMAMLLNYVPYLGAIVGVAITLLVAAVTLEGFAWVGVPVTYFLLTSLEGTLITPAILGRRFALDPVVVFLWLVFWSWLWSLGGALLAMPMLVMLRIISERAPGLATVGRLLSSADVSPVPVPPAPAEPVAEPVPAEPTEPQPTAAPAP